MPGGDGTGPAGAGRAKGRGAGFCAGFKLPGYMNFGFRKSGFLNQRRRCLPFLGALLPAAFLAYFISKQNKSKSKADGA